MPEFAQDPAISTTEYSPVDGIGMLGEMIQDAMLQIDAEGRILSANRIAQNLFKADSGHLVASNIVDWLPAFRFATKSRYSSNKHQSAGVLQPARTSENDALIQVSVQRQAFGSGVDRREIVVITQEDELTKLRRQLIKLEALVNQSAVPCTIQGPDGRIELANQALERVFGFTPEEVIGRLPREFLAGELTNQKEVQAGFATVLMGGSVKRDEAFYDKSGSIVWVNYEQHAITDDLGNVSYIVTTTTDISDRIKAERMKSDFVSMVGHELRTPLTAVAGTIDILADPRFASLSQELLEIVRGAKRSCDALNVLIGDLIDINKIEAGLVSMDRQSISIAACVSQVHTELQAKADARDITLHAPTGELGRGIYADPNRLRQILSNLTANAIKYGNPGGNVWTSVTCNANEVTVYVTDDGPGIDAALRPQVFDKFTRAAAVAADGIDGFGLGLAICKSLIEQMGGALDLVEHSTPGARFRIKLPGARTLPTTQTARRHPSGSSVATDCSN